MKNRILILLALALICLIQPVKAQTPIVIDYASSDIAYAIDQGLHYYFVQWEVNNRYQSSATDSSANFTCKWAAVRFDSLYDANLSISYPFATTALRIDTIRLDVNHEKNSGSSDTLTVSILERTSTQAGITSADGGLTWSNPVLWDTMIVTTTSLTPGVPTNQIGQLFIPCHFDVPIGTKFFIKVDFTGDTDNHFYMIDYVHVNCVPFDPSFSSASESIFPNNSWRYINLFIPPSMDLSGATPLIVSGQTPGCDLFYFQNFGIAINAGATPQPLVADAGNNAAICPGYSVMLGGNPTAVGGNPPFTYSWSPVTGLSCTDCANPTASPTVTTIYSVTVTDNSGATATDAVTVNSVTLGSFAPTTLIHPTSCSGSDGAMVFPAICDFCLPDTIYFDKDGVPQGPFLFSGWPSAGVGGLTAGSYTNIVIKLHGGGCSTPPAPGPFILSDPPSPVIDSFTITNVTCNGGSDGYICVSASNGNTPYIFTFPFGSQGNSCGGGLSAGSYTITVRDVNDCSVSGSATITEPTPIVLQISNVGDSLLSANVSGGCPPYIYLWSTGGNGAQSVITAHGTYLLTVTDACGCFITDSVTIGPTITVAFPNGGETFTTGQNVNVLWTSTGNIPKVKIEFYSSIAFNWITLADSVANTGAYLFAIPQVPDMQGSIRISDPYNASVSDQSDNLFNIVQSGTLVVTPVINSNVSCFGMNDGSVMLTVSGGTPPYQYSIDGGITFQASNTFQNLIAGNYSAIVSDALSVADTVSFTIGEPSPLNVSLNVVEISCYGSSTGSISLTPLGGTPPYSYLWNDSDTAEDRTNLPAGAYAGTISDANGCTVSINLMLTEPTPLVLQITNTGDGLYPDTLDVTVTGGCLPFTYQWNNGSTVPQTAIFMDGTYGLTVTDGCGCTISDSVSIGVGGFNATVTTENVRCFGDSNGEAVIQAYGGTPPYYYSIDGGNIYQPHGTFMNLVPGSYLGIAMDAVSSMDTVSFTITEPSPLQVDTVYTTDATCFGASDGTACVKVSGGTPYTDTFSTSPYWYIWAVGHPDSCSMYLPVGTYSVTVEDLHYCTATASFTIREPQPLIAQFVHSSDGAAPDTVLCYVSGGTPGYVVDWGDGQFSQFDTSAHIYYTDGVYLPIVTDNNGCMASDTITSVCVASCVWPGDADYNGIADNYDLLPIGLAYGTTGFARAQQDINWYGHVSQDWVDTLASGVNYKHSDCDGNGTINAADTLAIIQNFWLTHAKNSESKLWRISDPALMIELTPDTTAAGDTLYANLSLGNMNLPANDVYGLAFTVNYDPAVVDTTKTSVQFGNSWLGNSTDKISIAKDLKVIGQLKCAVTRIDHITRSGYGQIGQVNFVITTDNINGKDMLAYHQMNVWISDLVMIDNLGNTISVNEGSDSTQVEFEPVAVEEPGIQNYDLKIYPNPAADEIRINVSEELIGGELRLLDALGDVVWITRVTQPALKLQTRNLSSGLYFLQVVAQKGVIKTRLVVQ